MARKATKKASSKKKTHETQIHNSSNNNLTTKASTYQQMASQKSTRKEQIYSSTQLEGLKGGDKNLYLSVDQAMYLLQIGWDAIDQTLEKNLKYNWRWSGLKQSDAIEAILDNHEELKAYINNLKEGTKKKKSKTKLPISDSNVVDFKHASFSLVKVEQDAVVALLIQEGAKLIQFGEGTIELRINLNSANYDFEESEEYVLVWVTAMHPPFGTVYEGLPWAKREEVMIGGNVPWSKKKLAYANEVADFKKQSKRTSLVYFENDAISFDNCAQSATSCSQNNNRLMNTSLIAVNHQNTAIEEYVSTIADLQLQLNRCQKELVQCNQERKRQEARARSLEEAYATIRDEHLKFAKKLQDTIENSDILQPSKKPEQDSLSRDTIVFKGAEFRPTARQQRVMQGNKPRIAILELINLLKDKLKIDLRAKCYYMPGSQVEENDKNTKLKPNQLHALIQLVGKYIWMLKGKDTKEKRKAIAAALEFSRQIVKGKYQKGVHKQITGSKRKRTDANSETSNKRTNTVETEDEDDMEFAFELGGNEFLEEDENEEGKEDGDISLDEIEQYSDQ
jgi:hypothetical protein